MLLVIRSLDFLEIILSVMEFDDDTHLCLRCSKTIVGLENYVIHRQQHCLGVHPPYQPNEELSSTTATSSCEPPPPSSTPPENSPYVVHLTANDFFSSLELQSRTTVHKTDTSAPALPNDNQKCVSFSKDTTANEFFSSVEIPMVPPSLPELKDVYEHEALNVYEDNDIDYYPPTSYTGGKWKPGSRPNLTNRQQWDILNSPLSLSPQEAEKDLDDSILYPDSTMKSNASMNKKIENQIIQESNVFECNICNRKLSGETSFIRHLTTNYHKKKLAKENCVQKPSESHNENSIKNSRSILVAQTELNSCKNIDNSTLIFSKTLHKESFNCSYCNQEFSNKYTFAIHQFSFQHKDKFKSTNEWCLEMFRNEKILIHTLHYQCLICSFYFNSIECFVNHVKSINHRQSAAQLKKPQICLPCEFECRASDVMMTHLSKVHHKNNVTVNHPVIVFEKQNHCFCNFCEGKCRGISKNITNINRRKLENGCISPVKTKPSLIKKFKTQSTFHMKHRKQCIKLTNINCQNCLYICKNIQDWKEHMLQKHSDRFKECKLCNISFLTSQEYDSHIMTSEHNQKQETERKNNSNLCSLSNYSDAEVTSHDCDLHKIHDYSSQIFLPGTSADNKHQNIVKEHSNIEKNARKSVNETVTLKQQCPLCKKYYNKYQIKFHLFTHTGEKPFKCTICNKKFSQQSTLRMHMKHHLGLHNLKCKQCDFQTLKNSLLLRHEEKHKSNRPRPFLCDICGSAQLYKWTLKQHMKSHSVGKYKCTYDGCRHISHSHSDMTQHLRVHTNERPYLCDVCGYGGKTAHQLKKHQRSHTGERPFKCKHCSYSASLSSHLLRHMRLHTGSKPYKCPYCDYSCNNQENIRKHILKTKKHKGKKMYPCRYCDFGCNEFYEYREHLLNKHKEHFPKGEKNIDSSGVAGLYVKDFPRKGTVVGTYISKAEKLKVKRKKKKKKTFNSDSLKDAHNKDDCVMQNNSHIIYSECISIGDSVVTSKLTSKENCNNIYVAAETAEPSNLLVSVEDFQSEKFALGCVFGTGSETNTTEFVISAKLDCPVVEPTLQNQTMMKTNVNHSSEANNCTNINNVLFIYTPVT